VKILPFVPFAALLMVAGCNQNSAQTITTASDGDTTTTTTQTTQTAPKAPGEPVRGFVRTLHAVPGAGALSMVADAQKLSSTNYGDASTFSGVRARNVKISAFGSDGKKVAGPMSLSLDGGEDVTVLVTGIPGDIVLLPWKHKNRGPVAGKAKIAFVHSAKQLPATEIRIDEKSFRRNVKFGVATDYTTLSPGRHRVQVLYNRSLAPQIVEVEQPTVVTEDAAGNVVDVSKAAPTRTAVPRSEFVTLTEEVDLAAGKVYSLAVFAGANQAPKVRLMEDRFAPEIANAPSAD
jgi:hypothetical protein